MNPKIKTVNPKAGTLKLNKNAVWNNAKTVSRKMIAFVLMLGFTNLAFVQEDDSLAKGTTLGGATATTINKADTCCAAEKGKTKVDRKKVNLVLPSTDMLLKADNEVYVNLYASLRGANSYITALMLKQADGEIRGNFETEVHGKVSVPQMSSLANADETVNSSFIAENIGISGAAANMIQSADEEMNSRFIAENEGIRIPMQSITASADREINKNFDVENNFRISTPSAESYAVADNEISKNILKVINSKGIAKTSKKGRK